MRYTQCIASCATTVCVAQCACVYTYLNVSDLVVYFGSNIVVICVIYIYLYKQLCFDYELHF